MSKPKHSNTKRAVWVIATLVMLAMATAVVVVLIEDSPLEAQVEEVMKSHGFKMSLLLAPDSGVLVYTDFRASEMSDANLEELALQLEELASAEEVTRTQIDSGFSLRYDLEGYDQSLIVTLIPFNEVNGKWETVNAVMVSHEGEPISPWRQLLDMWPF